jgi:hypothetical protein
MSDASLVADTAMEPKGVTTARAKRARGGRRLFVAGLFLFLALGLAGVMGVHSAGAHAAGGGYDLKLRYAKTTRPGVSTPFAIELTKNGGFDSRQPVTLSLTSSYAETLQITRIQPEPSSETADGTSVHWQFDPPSGDTLAVSIGAEVDPSADAGRRRGTLAVLEGDRPVARVQFVTWVLP